MSNTKPIGVAYTDQDIIGAQYVLSDEQFRIPARYERQVEERVGPGGDLRGAAGEEDDGDVGLAPYPPHDLVEVVGHHEASADQHEVDCRLRHEPAQLPYLRVIDFVGVDQYGEGLPPVPFVLGQSPVYPAVHPLLGCMYLTNVRIFS